MHINIMIVMLHINMRVIVIGHIPVTMHIDAYLNYHCHNADYYGNYFCYANFNFDAY